MTTLPSSSRDPRNADPEHLLREVARGPVSFVARPPNPNVDLGTPHAVVLCCSDLNDLPERLLGGALGPVLAVQTAGALLTPTAAASLRYALDTTGARVVVALGHTRCRLVEHCWQGRPAPQIFQELLEPGFERVRRETSGRLRDVTSCTSAHNAGLVREFAKEWESSLGAELVVLEGLYDEDERRVTLRAAGDAGTLL